ncbi:MAG: histone deacetylase family protein [Bacteroidales bacterium]
MFRIRRIHDDARPVDLSAIEQVKSIMKSHFSSLTDEKLDEISIQLKDPLKYRFRTILSVAENRNSTVVGFALAMYASDLNFCYLDYIATTKNTISTGIGGALYQKVREEAVNLECIGLFYECLPDDSRVCTDSSLLPQNRARLKFYEKYQAYPLINTLYETPVKETEDCPPYLVCDFLGKIGTMDNLTAKKIIRAILERKYGTYCPEEYIVKVLDSVSDNPVKLREPLYIKKRKYGFSNQTNTGNIKIQLIYNDIHSIHHVRERGYVEAPVRIKSILNELIPSGIFEVKPPQIYSEKHILEVHDRGYLTYFKRICKSLPEGKSIYPYVFPIRNSLRPPKDDSVRAGYYCIDTFTPLNKNAYLASKKAVDCALSCADLLLDEKKMAYALIRPPGHHAERKSFGGFCYFNSAAIAANYLSKYGKVALLDIDYHHGNGQQNIFYKRDDVLTISIHGHPSFAYPYFSGFADEKGGPGGYGFNINYPLPENVSGPAYRTHLHKALVKIKNFRPAYLVLAFGLDVAKGDPTGTWQLNSADFEENGKMIGELRLPILVVQEGGYRTKSLGINALSFFRGLYKQYENDLKMSKV